jgi:hypothetical protein
VVASVGGGGRVVLFAGDGARGCVAWRESTWAKLTVSGLPNVANYIESTAASRVDKSRHKKAQNDVGPDEIDAIQVRQGRLQQEAGRWWCNSSGLCCAMSNQLRACNVSSATYSQ